MEIKEVAENQCLIRIEQKCYMKIDQKTYFSRSKKPFSMIPQDINLADLGLVDTKNIMPQVLRKCINTKRCRIPYPINGIPPLSKVYVQPACKRQLELEECEAKRRRLEYIQKITAIREEYRKQLHMEQEIKVLQEEIRNYFQQQWRELDHKGFYKMYAFMINQVKDRHAIVGALAEQDGIKGVYYIKGIHKNIFVKANENQEDLHKKGFITIPYRSHTGSLLNIHYYKLHQEPFATFSTNGITSYRRHKFTKIENLQFHKSAWLEIETYEPYALRNPSYNTRSAVYMQPIDKHPIYKFCKTLESIPECTELLIVAIKEIIYRGKPTPYDSICLWPIIISLTSS